MKDFEARNLARYLLWYAADGFIGALTTPALPHLWRDGLRDLYVSKYPWAVEVLPESWRGGADITDGQWEQVQRVWPNGIQPDPLWDDTTRAWWEWIATDVSPLVPETDGEEDSGLDAAGLLSDYLDLMVTQAAIHCWCVVFPKKLRTLCAEEDHEIPSVHLTPQQRQQAADRREVRVDSPYVTDEWLTREVTEDHPLEIPDDVVR